MSHSNSPLPPPLFPWAGSPVSPLIKDPCTTTRTGVHRIGNFPPPHLLSPSLSILLPHIFRCHTHHLTLSLSIPNFNRSQMLSSPSRSVSTGRALRWLWPLSFSEDEARDALVRADFKEPQLRKVMHTITPSLASSSLSKAATTLLA